MIEDAKTRLFECDSCHIQAATHKGLPKGWFQLDASIHCRLQATRELPRPFKGVSARMHRANELHLCSTACVQEKLDYFMQQILTFADSINFALGKIEEQKALEEQMQGPPILGGEE